MAVGETFTWNVSNGYSAFDKFIVPLGQPLLLGNKLLDVDPDSEDNVLVPQKKLDFLVDLRQFKPSELNFRAQVYGHLAEPSAESVWKFGDVEGEHFPELLEIAEQDFFRR